MLEACGLTKRFAGVTVLKDVNFTLVPSQVLGCVGPNAAGKTTTIRILTGLLEPTSGFVRFNGREIREDLVGFRRLYGYVPEEPHHL